MRVLHICPTHFSPDSFIAGAERYSYELAKSMARRTPTTLVTFGDKPFERRDGNLLIRCYKRWLYVKKHRGNPFAPAFLRDVLSADVIHCHQIGTVASDIATLSGALFRKKVFITDLAGSTTFSLSNYLPLWRAVSRYLLISEYNSGLFPKLRVPKSVIYGGVDTEVFKPSDVERRRTILFVGRLMPHKGIELLLQAADPDMEILIVGRPYVPEYRAALQAAAAGKNVQFREDFDDAKLLEAYQRAALVAIPSLVDGGYTTALEAMACATPVVGTAVGSLPELVKDGVTGFIVSPDDVAALRQKLRLLLDDSEQARQMGEAGRKHVKALFTWDTVVDRCFEQYNN